MWQRLLRRLFLPVVLVVLSSFILGLLDALTRSSATLSFYSLFAVFHLYLAPAAAILLSALAIAVAVQGRRWGWTIVLASATAIFLVRPLLFSNYGRSPLAIQMQDGPFFWYAAVLYSLFY